MLFLADCNNEEWLKIRDELDMPIGQLITPLTGRTNHGGVFAIDNGAYAKYDAKRFGAILGRERGNRANCLFVAVPDVVGSAYRTREVFDMVAPSLALWPLAYVCQDGQESVPIPWRRIAAIFIGGTNRFKTSSAAEACIRSAQIVGAHVHVGRVNDPKRFMWCEKMGVDSIDGSGISRYSHMRTKIGERNEQVQIEFVRRPRTESV
jgi:hypothetical protein